MAKKTLTVENRHEVPVTVWRKWSAVQQARFNNLYTLFKTPGLIAGAHKIDKGVLDVIAWNAAWSAASAP